MGVDIVGLAGLDIRRDGVDRLDGQMSVDLPPRRQSDGQLSGGLHG